MGARLVDALAARRHSVTAFDRFSGGTPNFSSSTARAVVGDFFNRGDLIAALSGQDYVFHFLSTTTPAAAENDPVLDLTTNISPTVELLRLSVNAGVSRFYFASSGGTIYGDQSKLVYTEKDATRPKSPYGIGKLAIENYLEYFRVKHGLDSYSLRISNPYGPGQHPHSRQGLIPIVLDRLRKGLPIVKVGDGSMVRDYIFADDLVEMIMMIVEGDAQHRTYNLGSGAGHTVDQVLTTIEKVTGRDLDVSEVEKPKTFVDRVVLDTRRYASEFGSPRLTSLATGIDATWHRVSQ